MPVLRALPLDSGPALAESFGDLVAMAAGARCFLPVVDDPDAPDRRVLEESLGVGTQVIDPDACLVIATSGSTGDPKGAIHTPATLAASADATHARLGGAGNWLLALPPHHIAGLQVLLRALRAGYTPAIADLRGGFDVQRFTDAVTRLRGPRRYTSLVPTQLVAVLRSPEATAALAGLDAVLVGGAAIPTPLAQRARAACIPLVTTYGMSETGGGCVYGGRPLDGVAVSIDDEGRVVLSGPMVAHGYHRRSDPAFAVAGSFRTDDLGRVDDGVLTVLGRADDAISTGGLTVVPRVVEDVLAADPAVAQCAVVGVPDERLGEEIVALVVAEPGRTPNPESLRASVAQQVHRHAAPRRILVVDEIPLRGPGKIDRAAVRTLAARARAV
ncbi:MAG TPA: o-succinylbenzoate--CoA ligase [Gordonia sp. (in: high G+C Gram-positive bacteria)]|uniref:o-succinylbenzoate--CoA ligase n=1 Tax=unclassified Gordonia (in: high G+C Gram-positive bacteria) TaxID=2657482 RepID=UPI0025B85BAD|nr:MULTISPECIES: o-succinylbenzoate--CoA ligase [unclassified Gordonia (in: high G+C Gram-positive bacteria)]HNP56876.1 o-succinylbenzoate--CoA ligase [Gordonia sp. (in: high G+C Gram-positive bacteria)]HRC51949.1 o-succinylbenzoate--CoA ligase [Gordonia sp. (in: high G+C Gram-positive bacteria)]